MDFANINPVKALYWTAVVNGVLAPFLLLGILLVACDSKIMSAAQFNVWPHHGYTRYIDYVRGGDRDVYRLSSVGVYGQKIIWVPNDADWQ
jgi:Mn2+/Fe2+ NRAMP family transporter